MSSGFFLFFPLVFSTSAIQTLTDPDLGERADLP
jgi:hypothetical protein